MFCSELVCFYLKVLCLLEGNANVLRAINVLKIKSSNKLKLFVCILVFSDRVLSSLIGVSLAGQGWP